MAEMKDIDPGSSSIAKIRYETVRNQLASQKAGTDMNVARVYTNRTYQLREMAEELVNRKVPLSRQLISYVLGELSDLMQSLLVQGNSINLGGLVKLTPVIKGTFAPGESFDASKHEIVVAASIGKVLRGAASTGSVEKVGAGLQPEIESIKNTVTFEDDVLFALTTGTVKGKNLGYDAAASDEGLFVDAAGVGIELIAATATEINFRLTGEVETETTAVLSFKTRGGDKNLTDPTVVTRTVTLKPAE